jgi:hypothetical protein
MVTALSQIRGDDSTALFFSGKYPVTGNFYWIVKILLNNQQITPADLETKILF